ncbi:helix-turn-helix domain-containing protein [Bacteroides uniformis]|uniref:helix-turn-helix domain-containing protein n=1 Tax=Bacteroides uniformis TaxID=820 RepID=UPI00233E6C2F|nr:helix-turn-helix domain-containing protein [Bacteroides uniformis]MDC1809365.1 helix-turn-helix domain-containing protein [Bacteroides uniformis]
MEQVAKKRIFAVLFFRERMTDVAIYTINITCIALMVLLVIILSAATRLKGGAAYAAIIILVCNTSVYIYNMARVTGMYDLAETSMYFSQSNALLMPLMWLFVLKELNPQYRFSYKTLLHFIPSIGLLLFAFFYFSDVSKGEFASMMINETTGENRTYLATTNDIVIAIQVFIYFPLIFSYIRKTERKLKDCYSDSDYVNILWIKRVMIFFAVQFSLILIVYTLYPQTDVWFVPIMNLIASSYLVYNCITYPTAVYMSRVVAPINNTEQKTQKPVEQMDLCSMERCYNEIELYLKESQAFKQADFSLAALSVATGISQKMISRSINGYANKNFFDLINGMRIEEAKRLMQNLQNNYTIESVFGECGFRSRSTFYLVFKKFENTTPTGWLKMVEKTKSSNLQS